MDLDFTIDCPECGGNIKVTTRDVAQGKTVRCSRGHRVPLEDHGGGARKAQKAMDDLDRTLRDFGR